MPAIEWISPYGAVARLQELWGITPSVVEEIVRNVVQGGKVEVRAVQRGHFVPQIVTGQIQLSPYSLFATDYEDTEIDWNGLVEEGRKLIPSWQVPRPTKQKRSPPRKRRASIAAKQASPNGPKRGPARGTTGFQASDRTLFPEMETMIAGKARSPHGAALMLARDNKVAGAGHEDSKAKRLAARYRKERRDRALKLSETL
jgi:hypothetical protein